MARRYLFNILAVSILVFLACGAVSARQDGGIDRDALFHDSRSDLYRTPGGAAPLGSAITLRLRAAAGNLDSAMVRTFRTLDNAQNLLPMRVVATTPDGYDYWEAQVELPRRTTVVYYRFLATSGSETLFYEDDTRRGSDYFEAAEGGVGTVYDESPDLSFQISVYDPAYTTPEWMHNAVIYQIFPDRFRNGDRANDPVDGSFVFYDDLPLLFHETWNEPPIDGRRVQTASGAGYFNSDFFGGDLAGIIEKLDYLADLGVTAIYLNPIFEARSNHRYDTVDYLAIDPLLGDLETFRALVQEADARGIRLILDGVFNHMSSDSPFFDRYHRFVTSGACESTESPWREWFLFVPPRAGQPSPCVETPTGDQYYVSWAGFDTIPKINSDLIGPRRYFFLDENSVARTWGAEGIGGWRLDVANEIDAGRNPADLYWEAFRTVVKDQNPEAVIIGEVWNDASEWLLGDEWDSVMNYRFRRAILGFVRGERFVDNDGVIPGLTPSEFIGAIRAVEEDYPRAAYLALMSLVDSHDTSRLLFVVDGDKRRQQLAALAQYTLPGAPTVYYGDEIALDAPSVVDTDGNFQDDPYNRAPYPWSDTSGDYYPAPDESMLAFYQTLGAMRGQNAALRTGDMTTLVADDDAGVAVWLRADRDSGNIALAAFNVSDQSRDVTLDLSGLAPTGMVLEPVFDGEALTAGDSLELALPALSGGVWAGDAGSDGFATPPRPQGLVAESQTSSVSLAWQEANGAAGYHVYRSPVATGGFERVTDEPLTETTFIDESVVNGYAYYYAIAAISAGDIAGEMSEPARAVPSADITASFFVAPDGTQIETAPEPAVVQFVSGATVPVRAAVVIAGVTDEAGQAPGVRAEAGLVQPGQNIADIQWTPMQYIEDQNSADVYGAELTPRATGEFELRARFSTDSGETWTEVELTDGGVPMVIVEASTDTTPPDAPASVEVLRASLSGVVLTWSPVEADELFAYRVYRIGAEGAREQIGEVNTGEQPRFIDRSVVAGDSYQYGVSAVDRSLNESDVTATDAVRVEQQVIPVTFTVTVPEGTEGDVYIAGSFGASEYPSWDPGGLVMEQVDDTHWTITLNLPEGANVEYKYVRSVWERVEKGSECEEIANRRLAVVYGESDQIAVNDTVAAWRDTCGV